MKRKGFTLIELMVVIAIIGVLAATAVNRFTNLLAKSKEAGTRAGLTSLRSALNIYYGDNGERPSDDLSALTANGKYIASIPLVRLPGTGHPDTSSVIPVSVIDGTGDTGGWAYLNDPSSPYHGTIIVNCTHKDLAGKPWSAQ